MTKVKKLSFFAIFLFFSAIQDMVRLNEAVKTVISSQQYLLQLYSKDSQKNQPQLKLLLMFQLDALALLRVIVTNMKKTVNQIVYIGVNYPVGMTEL